MDYLYDLKIQSSTSDSMKQLILIFILTLCLSCSHSQGQEIDPHKIKEDLTELLSDLSQSYIYADEKKVDFDCIREHYSNEIKNIKTEEEKVLFFEYLLDEFYDSHVMLNTNRQSSFRLYAPIYVTLKNGKAIITNVWQHQISNLDDAMIGSELLKVNGIEIAKKIEQFPTHCNDKTSDEVREWIINKIIAGRRNEPRLLELKLTANKLITIDLDKLKIRNNSGLLNSRIENNIGIIEINNSLGQNDLITAFDKSLDELINTEGLIIDLRNTVDGGNSYVARGIMSRLISESQPYQKHWSKRQYDGNPMVPRTWMEYVDPRGDAYKNPVVVLVGRWTGSMGEGLAIGLDGMNRAQIVGSEMERLAGEMNGFSFKHQNFGYRLSTAKLFHINGTPREEYIPTHYVKQTTTEVDETLTKGIELLHKMKQ